MIKIIQKNVKNKDFYYLSDQINIDGKFKKIQVYLGKTIPKDLSLYYKKLAQKEIDLILDNIKNIYNTQQKLELKQIEKVEKSKVAWKYFYAQLSEGKKQKFWRKFAIEFIFQSNAIEGSKLSQSEVEKIIKNTYIKKTLARKEVLEVTNSLKAFEFIKGKNFKLNQKQIKQLHQIITKDLEITEGYKKRKIIVNNKETVAPGQVRSSLSALINSYKKRKKENFHPFFLAVDFHHSFEYIHPFEDGNGRVGRLVLVWMIAQSGYGAILFKLQNRQRYFKALDHADNGRKSKLYWYVVETYIKTIENNRKLK